MEKEMNKKRERRNSVNGGKAALGGRISDMTMDADGNIYERINGEWVKT